MAKLMTVILGGKERTLDVGKWFFTEYIGEVTESDPIASTGMGLRASFQQAWAIVWAGMMTDYSAKSKEPDFTKEDVRKWVGLMEAEEVAQVISKYNEITGAKKDEALENGA